ncbi:hypothetical protein PRIC1_006477 [Phytophthora ramorum]
MLPLLAAVSVVCRNYPRIAAEEPIVRLIESFVDTSVGFSLDRAIGRSLELVTRVLTRMNRGQVVAELCEAAGSGNVHVVETLCAAAGELLDIRTADLLNERDLGGNSALSKAGWGGNIQMLDWLLAHGVTLDARNARGQTVLHQAATQANLGVVEWLVDNGLRVDDADGDGFTALLKAAQYGRFNVAEWLLERGASVSKRSISGQSALHIASGGLRENLDVATILVDRGLKASDTDKWGHTALHHAAVAKHLTIIEFFLKNCFSDEAPRRTDLQDALFAASNVGNSQFVENVTTDFGLDISHVNDNGRTALHEAAAGGSVETAELLVERGLAVDQADNLGITPIIEASRLGHSRVLSYLLSAEWDTDDVDLAGRTALHHAAVGGHMAVIDTLLYSADTNCCDRRGWTPLHCAAAAGRLQAVQVLIDNGATLDCETISGKTALVLALERGHTELADVLLEMISNRAPETAPESAPNALDDYTEYRLDRSDIQFESPLLQDCASGMWLDSPVQVKVKKRWQSKNIVEELEQWSKLSHPHVVKLYGVCHGNDVDDPFFVYERPTHGSLFEYLGNEANRARVWDKLHEAAMGLAYLHDRDVVHGDISCANIAIAANGFAKLKNLGGDQDEIHFRQNPSWTSPEVLAGSPPTFASDVFAFGLTIVQAFKTTGDLWNLFGGARDEAIRSGHLPNKPDEMTPPQWKLIRQMCCFEPRERLSASDVVRELEAFTYEHENPDRFSVELDEREIPLCWANLGDVPMISVPISTVTQTLHAIERMTSEVITMNDMNRDVYKRLVDVFDQLKARTDSPSRQLVQRYTSILHYSRSCLERTRALGCAVVARFVAIRQEADDAFSVHGDIDLLMASTGLCRTGTIHDWRHTWEHRRNEQRRTIMHKLKNVVSLLEDVKDESDREEALTYLRFELAKHPTSYFAVSSQSDVASAEAVISSLAASKNSNWFIPAYEVDFDSLNEFSSGAFGSVHQGKWKSAQVIVKKLLLSNRRKQVSPHTSFTYESEASTPIPENTPQMEAVFLNEVEIWCKLYHPSVVQLFGACHVGEPFFVCEFAGGGQLDKYLRSHPDEVWGKLYEAALGLRYLHAKNIVHGDLKCNNILIGSDGRAKLTDFGLSALEISSQDEVEEPESELQGSLGHNVGAIRWKAPEVLHGDKSSFASDVYSFGMCILEAVSGGFPWGTLDDMVVKYHVNQRSIPQRPPKCSEKAYNLVQQMCAYDPSARVEMKEAVNYLAALR